MTVRLTILSVIRLMQSNTKYTDDVDSNKEDRHQMERKNRTKTAKQKESNSKESKAKSSLVREGTN